MKKITPLVNAILRPRLLDNRATLVVKVGNIAVEANIITREGKGQREAEGKGKGQREAEGEGSVPSRTR